MKSLMLIGLALVIMFGLGIGAYAALKVPIKNLLGKVATFVAVSVAAIAVTFVVCLAVVWPPVTM